MTKTFTWTAASPITDGRSRRATCPTAGWAISRDGATRYPLRCRSGSCTASWPSPPSTTPMARDRMDGFTWPLSRSTQRIMPTFCTAGATAGAKKRPWALSAPMAKALRPTRVRYGNMTRVSSAASASCPGSRAKPGAITRTIHGARTTPSTVDTERTHSVAPSTARTMRAASAGARVGRVLGHHGNQGGGQRPLAQQPPEHVGDAVGHEEGVGDRPGPEGEGHDHVPGEAQDPAEQSRAPHGGERAQDLALDAVTVTHLAIPRIDAAR